MNFLRKLKISQIVDISFNPIETDVNLHINSILNSLILYKSTFGECFILNYKVYISIRWDDFWEEINNSLSYLHNTIENLNLSKTLDYIIKYNNKNDEIFKYYLFLKLKIDTSLPFYKYNADYKKFKIIESIYK